MLREMRLGIVRYWAWVRGGGFWTKVMGLGGPVLAVIFVIAALSGGGGTEEANAPADEAAAPAPTIATRLDEIRRSFREGFGPPIGADWYGLVKEITISGRTLVVSTDIRNDAEGRQFAAPICSAASNYVFANDASYGLTAVRITGQGGATLTQRTSLRDRC